MKTFSWVQPNFQQGPKEFNAHYLPYSAGILWAYLQQFDFIKSNFKLGDFIWKRDAIEVSLKKISNSDIVGFSTYVWNKSYNYTLAKRLKEINPNCLILFGGPEPAIADPKFFDKFPFIDICVKQEGEITLKKVLENLLDKESLSKVKGLIINDNGDTIDTGPPERIQNLDEVPSPYLIGLFDDLINQYPNVEWNATLETDRGCPYQCTFCDWGSLTYNKVKKFNLERVFDEIEWMGQNKCGYVSITNANFGIFPERDNLIADKLIEVQEKYGYPKAISVAWAKNQKQEVVDIVKKFITSPGFNTGLTVSVQSMDVDVLENIKRKNLEINKINEIFDICDKSNIPVYTELILGLPGETINTWKENFWRLFELGNHTGISIYQAQLLENAEMNLVQKKLFKIKSQVVYDYMSGSYNEDELKEGISVITETKDLPFDKMLESHIFTWFINTFHINGISTYISRLLNKRYNISYSEFYERLFDYLQKDDWFKFEMYEVNKHYENWMTTGSINHPPIHGVEIHGWNVMHRTLINIHVERKYDYIFKLLNDFLINHLNLDKLFVDQLMQFQDSYLIRQDHIQEYPKILNFNYDFLGYLQDDTELEIFTQYKFDFNEDKDMDIVRFCENLYFKRKRNFGKAWVSKV